MKSKRIIVVVVSSVVLCLSLFFIFQNETDTSISNKDLTLIYENWVILAFASVMYDVEPR